MRTCRQLVSTSAFLFTLALAVSPATAQQDCLPGGSGASLLFPYFEVDLDSGSSETTLLSVTNAANAPRMTRVVLWTDWGIPTMAFDIFLPAFDVQTLNLRDTLNGAMPATGIGEDLSAFQNCNIAALAPENPSLFPAQVASLKAAHTGNPTGVGVCKGQSHGDNIARGYVTIDVVDQCSGVEAGSPQVTPANSGLPYFGSVALNSNVLQGDFFLVDPDEDSAQGYQAVALWADTDRFTGADTHTFYGRYHDWDGSDHRLPLAQVWNARFANGGGFDGGTDFFVWRDTKSSNTNAQSCMDGPPWYPLVEDYITERSEEGEIGLGLSDTSFFDLATTRVTIAELDPPHDFGRVQFGLGHTTFSNRAQSWVGWRMTASGRFSVGQSASQAIDNCESDPTP